MRRPVDQEALRAEHGPLDEHGEVQGRVGLHRDKPIEREVHAVQVHCCACQRPVRQRVQGHDRLLPAQVQVQRAVGLGRRVGQPHDLGAQHPHPRCSPSLRAEEGKHGRQVRLAQRAGVVARDQARAQGHVDAGERVADPVVRPAWRGLVLVGGADSARGAGRVRGVAAGRRRERPLSADRAGPAPVGPEVQELPLRAAQGQHLHVVPGVQAGHRRDDLCPMLQVGLIDERPRGDALEQVKQDLLREPRAVERRAVGHEDLQREVPPAFSVRGPGALLQHKVEGPAGRAVGAPRVGVGRAAGRLVPTGPACRAGPADQGACVHEGPRRAGEERHRQVDALALGQGQRELEWKGLGIGQRRSQTSLELRQVDALRVHARAAGDFQAEGHGVGTDPVARGSAGAQLDIPRGAHGARVTELVLRGTKLVASARDRLDDHLDVVAHHGADRQSLWGLEVGQEGCPLHPEPDSERGPADPVAVLRAGGGLVRLLRADCARGTETADARAILSCRAREETGGDTV